MPKTVVNESKRQRFVRISEMRTNKIIDMLRLLGNCANTATYEYTEDDVKQIFSTIDLAVKNSKSKFISNGVNETRFKLKL